MCDGGKGDEYGGASGGGNGRVGEPEKAVGCEDQKTGPEVGKARVFFREEVYRRQSGALNFTGA